MRGLRKVYPVVTSMPMRSDRSSLAVWNSRFRLLSSVVRFSTEAAMVSTSAWTASPVTSRAWLRVSSSWAVSSRSWVKETFSWRMYTLAKSLLAWVTAAWRRSVSWCSRVSISAWRVRGLTLSSYSSTMVRGWGNLKLSNGDQRKDFLFFTLAWMPFTASTYCICLRRI